MVFNTSFQHFQLTFQYFFNSKPLFQQFFSIVSTKFSTFFLFRYICLVYITEKLRLFLLYCWKLCWKCLKLTVQAVFNKIAVDFKVIFFKKFILFHILNLYFFLTMWYNYQVKIYAIFKKISIFFVNFADWPYFSFTTVTSLFKSPTRFT